MPARSTSDFDPTAVAIEAVESQDARRAYERSRIDMLRTYAELRDCRRRFLLEYFGEPAAPDWVCGNCDACDTQRAYAERARRAVALA